MYEKCINRDFPVSSTLLTSYALKAIYFSYNPNEKDNAKRLFIPPNPCEAFLLEEYPELVSLWEIFKPKLKECYDRLTDEKGKGAPTKSWLELDAQYCIVLFDTALKLYPQSLLR